MTWREDGRLDRCRQKIPVSRSLPPQSPTPRCENLLPEFPDFEVYIDSPLAVEATNIFHKNVKECFRDRALELIKKGVNPIGFPGLKVAVSSDESKMINFINKMQVFACKS
mgnify:CR=1 FL=1